MSLSFFLSERFPESGFKPLEDYARLHCLSSISVGGWGVDNAIRYEGAVGESKLMQKLNIFKSDQTQTGKER